MNVRAAAVPATGVETIVRERTGGGSPTWRNIVVCATVFVTLLDAALLERKHGLFTGGFLASHQLGTIIDALAFLLVSALLTATIVAPLSLAALLIGRRLRLKPAPLHFGAFCAAVAPLATADVLTYKVWAYLGDSFDFEVLSAVTGHRLSEVFAVAAPLLGRPAFLFGCGLLGLIGTTAVLQRLHGGEHRPSRLPLLVTGLRQCLVLVIASSLAVIGIATTSESMAFGLRWTPSGELFTRALNRLSDFDGDGSGLLRNPRDSAPFDSAIHPYALDVPGNGIDEDGIAGDLPPATDAEMIESFGHVPWPQRPPVILFVLESVRADVVGAVHHGHRVTPVMDSLAAEGLKLESAWSHAGSTSQSRYHILTGSLIPGRGDSTLLDDFKDHGYDVAYFSGQDDDFGTAGVDYRRVDKFYDARQDIATRYSTLTTPGSLAVPLTVVEARVREYLAPRSTRNPLFLYVNFHDTHYPYNHAGLENLLDVTPLPASLISPSHRADVISTYLNAVANVDRAIGRVISAVASHTGQPPAVVIIGDHGESLFDEGVLGHGFGLNDAQTKVPLIVRGLPATLPTPFGLTDLRATVNAAMAQSQPSARPIEEHSAGKRIFQYLGTLDTPSQIGWNTAAGLLTYDFRTDRIGIWGTTISQRDLVGGPKAMFYDLVNTWERMLVSRGGSAPD